MLAAKQSRYVLTERIAQGGMAEIFLGRMTTSDGFTRICAFKKILPQYSQNQEFLKMFRTEALVAKQLQHKNIVQVFDFDSVSNGFALVMEFVEGQDLKNILVAAEMSRKRIPVQVAVFLACEVLSGLSYAHEATDLAGQSMNIVHRDVSPQNILVGYDGSVKITDFGIAKTESVSFTEQKTKAGVIKGKFSYMSPEQAEGLEVDFHTDIFAMGIVLYEMLSMRRLFKGNDIDVLNAVKKCQIPRLHELPKSIVPEELSLIVDKMLSKNKSDRFLSTKELIIQLNTFLYHYKPDFMAGELSDYMQLLFPKEIESSKMRVRNTLSLPEGMNVNSHIVLPNSQQPTEKHHSHLNLISHAPTTAIEASVAFRLRRQRTGPSKLSIFISFFVFFMLTVSAYYAYHFVFKGSAEISIRQDIPVQIKLNGKFLTDKNFWPSPIHIDVPIGSHRLEVIRPGFETQVKDFSITKIGMKRQINIDLKQVNELGELRIITIPAGATVSLDNESGGGISPVLLKYLPLNTKLGIKIVHPQCDPTEIQEVVKTATRPQVRRIQLKSCKN